MKIIKCQECNKETKADSNATKYCRPCAKKVLKRQNKEINRKEKLEKKRKLNLKCEECGVSLTNILHVRKYCLECRKTAYKKIFSKKSKEYYKKNRQKYLDYNKKYCQIPENKERHRIQARESMRRRRLKKQR